MVKVNDPDAQSDHIDNLGLLVGIDQFFKLVRGLKRVDRINLIETAGRCVIAGVLLHRYAPKNIQQNIAIIARVSAIEHPPVIDTTSQLDTLTKDLWELETIGIKDIPDTLEER